MPMASPALDADLTALFGGGCRARVARLDSAHDESHLHEAELSRRARRSLWSESSLWSDPRL